MNILITGGQGFIGRNLTTRLQEDKHTITVIDNMSTSRTENNIDSDIIMIQGDLGGDIATDVESAIKEADLIYHLAGSVGVKYIDENPSSTLRNSFGINNNLFPLFEKYQKKVVFASTSEVYGETNNAKETDTLKIGSPDTARWSYACAKLMSEFLLKSYSFPSVIVRFFNVVGPGQLPDYGMVLPNFIKNEKEQQPLVVYGDGEQTRTFCDIRDAVEMLTLLGLNDEHNNEIYNIGNDKNSISIKELALKISDDIEYRDYSVDFSSNFGEIYERKPCIDKIKAFYEPKYSVDDIIKSLK